MYKTQITSLLILLYMDYFYKQNKHLQIEAIRVYKWLYTTGVLNIVLDILTVFTITRIEFIPGWVTLTIHTLFILNIDLFVFLIYKYILCYIEEFKRIPLFLKILQMLPFILSIIGILVLPLSYYVGVGKYYSYGPKTYALYISIMFYVFFILYYTLRYWSQIEQQKRRALFGSTFIIMVVASIQFSHPEYLVSGVGMMLVLSGILMSNVNPREYLVRYADIFNKYAFTKKLNELFHKNKVFTVLGIYWDDFEMTTVLKDEIQGKEKMISELNDYILDTFKLSCFQIQDNAIAVIVMGKNSNEIKQKLEERFKEAWQCDDRKVCLEAQVVMIECPKMAHMAQEVIHHIQNAMIEWNQRAAYIDTLTEIKNRNAFEKEKLELFANRYEYNHIACIEVDINNLKVVNDTLGHIKGDELIKSMSYILQKCMIKNDMIYRTGGDEFVVLLVDHKEDEVKEAIERIQIETKKYNERAQLRLSFAIGYAIFRQGRDQSIGQMISRADTFMYKNKINMKQANQ